MFILMSIHHPKPEYRAALIDSMHRYQNAIKDQTGLVGIHTLKDELSPRLVGLAILSRLVFNVAVRKVTVQGG